MTGLIILLILLLLIFLVLIYNRLTQQSETLYSLKQKLWELNNEVSDLTNELRDQKSKGNIIRESEKITPAKESFQTIKPETKTETPIFVPKEEPAFSKKNEVFEFPQQILQPSRNVPAKNKAGWLSGTDMEKFIGENIANKIGIAVLVLGISFFVKYAIDKNWINETGRVIIGLAAGSILVGIAHYIRNSYRSFSSVLIGGGLTVFYFTIAFAFHQYHLISQTLAFICMVVITAFAVLVSVRYDRKELAILATIGGFITPALVSTGEGNYIVLFTYIGILCTGLMSLSWFKKWIVINILAVLFTTAIYGGWLVANVVFGSGTAYSSKIVLAFGALYYLLFVAMVIINNIRMKRVFSSFDYLSLFFVNFLFFAEGMIILSASNDANYQGLFTFLLGLFNLALAGFFFRRLSVDRNFVSALIALALSFISLTAPIQFEGDSIAMFWAAESVLLLWLFQRTRLPQLQIASSLLSLLLCWTLVFIWNNLYLRGEDVLPILLNKAFVTSIVAAISFFIQSYLLSKETSTELAMKLVRNSVLRNVYLGAALIVGYVTGMLEIFNQFSHRVTESGMFITFQELFTFAYSLVVLFVFRKTVGAPRLQLFLTLFCLGFYVLGIEPNLELAHTLVNGNLSGTWHLGHWAGSILLGILLLSFLISDWKKQVVDVGAYRPALTWVVVFGMLLLLSIEMYHIMLWLAYTKQEEWTWWKNLYSKAGLSILWSICSFLMIWLGMRYHFRTLRIISLTLFTLTIVKLFFYDIINIPAGGKIVAFILLGVLLLTVSFMYQRLRKIIARNDESESKTQSP